MSNKAVFIALAAAFTAAAQVMTKAASAEVGAGPADTGGKAPPPRAAVAPAGKPAAPAPRGGKKTAAAPGVDFETLKASFMELVKEYEGGQDLAIATLDRFGVKKLNEVDAAQYQELFDYLAKVKTGDENPLESSDDTGAGDDDLLG